MIITKTKASTQTLPVKRGVVRVLLTETDLKNLLTVRSISKSHPLTTQFEGMYTYVLQVIPDSSTERVKLMGKGAQRLKAGKWSK